MNRIGSATGRHTIAIVGGGFCGTALATRLLRSTMLAECDIVLIEREALVGRGVAYARHAYPYLLNVPAGHMSADSQRPGEFVEFARRVLPRAQAGDFLPRALYGDYLEQRLQRAAAGASSGVRLVRVQDEVVAVTPGPRLRLTLRSGAQVLANEVTLALGNAAATPVPGLDGIPMLDPWSALKHVEPEHSVLLVGTGLTMVDVAVSLETRVRGPGRLHALSRRGLLPRAHGGSGHSATVVDTHRLLTAGSHSLRALTRAVRESVAEGGWHAVFSTLRRIAPALWQRLSAHDQARFVRHLRPWWDAHRHRLPAAVAARLERMRTAGALAVHAGHIESARIIDGRIHVSWRPRAGAQLSTLAVDHVVNCTGPAHSVRTSTEPMMRWLFDAGWIAADSLGLGLRTGTHGNVLDADGSAVRGLFYVGPLLRAKYWEATAVPELRRHVESTAAALERRAAPLPRVVLSRRGVYATGAPAA
jgi:uncharacterized NAD(P)/FAD-binding protein YdhS